MLKNKKLIIIHFQAFLSACVQSKGGFVCLTISSLFAPGGFPEWAFWRKSMCDSLTCTIWLLALLGCWLLVDSNSYAFALLSVPC